EGRSQLRSAFTLVEMLVVITILILLASLLQPAIQNTLARAHITGCMSNLRQQGNAFIAYTAEHQQHLPKYRAGTGNHHALWGFANIGWERALAPYLNVEVQDDPRQPTGSSAFICPASSVRWDPTLIRHGRGPGNYWHGAVPTASGHNPYDGLYYNYRNSTQNQSENLRKYESILRLSFYVHPPTQPLQWCSQRLIWDPNIGYNTNTLGALSWHQKISARPTLFMDGRVVQLRRPVHNTYGSQIMLSAKHEDNTNYNGLRGISIWENGGTYGLNFSD
ncbi:MAG: type II secretion system protein, partial [Kiritimatiellae bacterium]|nr:type II secretion system protein [Kiritimatiellia bacterium]